MSVVRPRRSGAGAGATAMAAKLGRRERPKVWLAAAAGAIPGVLIGILFTAPVLGLALALVGALAGGLWQRARGDAARWRMGASGERRTGRHLDLLRLRRGWRVLHDRQLPGTRANLDHVVVEPAGRWVALVDAKVRTRRAKYDPRSNFLFIGRTSGFQLVSSTEFEAKRLAETLEAELGRPVPVYAALAVHRAAIPSWREITLKGVRVLPAREVRGWLLSQAGPPSPAGREVATACERVFPPYT